MSETQPPCRHWIFAETGSEAPLLSSILNTACPTEPTPEHWAIPADWRGVEAAG